MAPSETQDPAGLGAAAGSGALPGATSAAACGGAALQLPPLPSTSPPLFEHVVVCGLSGQQGLRTVQGEQGFLGSDRAYAASFLDRLPHGDDPKRQPPPQLPTCCLPAGVDIILKEDLPKKVLNPRTYSVVLTEGDGTKVYASCLAFYDEPPAELRSRHEQLCGARALKALCLLSRRPYLACSERVLREIYSLTFVTGSAVPVADVIEHLLLSVPCPSPLTGVVRFPVGAARLAAFPAPPVGPPAGELSLQPLAEALSPHNIAALFVAVLLERRVLLRSKQYRLLTLVAESVVRLLHPFKFQHVYIPVMPYSLVDYLEAPTPFLMGLHASDELDAATQDGLVVADLEADSVTGDPLLPRCMAHPYAARLTARLRALLQPCNADTELLGAPTDAWVAAAHALAAEGWGPRKQALMARLFLEFFSEVLDGYEAHIARCRGSIGGGGGPGEGVAAAAEGRGPAARGRPGPGGVDAPGPLPSTQSGSFTLGCASASSSFSRFTALSGGSAANLNVNMTAIVTHHETRTSRSTDQTLLQQLLQGQSFYSFVEEQAAAGCCDSSGISRSRGAPPPWLARAEESLEMWLRQEQELARGAGALDELAGQGRQRETVVPPLVPRLLRPPKGAVHAVMPPLLLTEPSPDGSGAQRLRRRTSGNGRKDKRQSVARRRAISEFSGASTDLRRKGPGAKDAPALRSQPDPPASGLQAASFASLLMSGPSATGLAAAAAAGAAGSLSVEYSAEADLVRRQTSTLLAVLAQPVNAKDGGPEGCSFKVPRRRRRGAAAAPGGGGGGSGAAAGPAPVAAAATPPPAAPAAPPAATTPSPSKSSIKGTFSMAVLTVGALGGGGIGMSKSFGSTFSGGKNSLPALASAPPKLETPLASPAAGSAPADVGAAASGVEGAAQGGSKPQPAMNVDDLDAARDLLSIQTGGNGWFLISRLKEEVVAGMAAAAAAAPASASDTTPEASEAAGGRGGFDAPCDAPAVAAAGLPSQQQGQQQQQLKGQPAASSWWGRRVSEGAFGVLRDMMRALLEAAALQEDWRVVVAALQISDHISCTTATGVCRRLIAALGRCPIIFAEWFWSGAFGFAVSAAYLGGENRAELQDVVAATLAEFAHLITGVGISGSTAWLLLTQLAGQHLTHMAPLRPEVLTALRAHLANLDALPRGGGSGGGSCAATYSCAGHQLAAALRATPLALPPRLPPTFARVLGLSLAAGAGAAPAAPASDSGDAAAEALAPTEPMPISALQPPPAAVSPTTAALPSPRCDSATPRSASRAAGAGALVPADWELCSQGRQGSPASSGSLANSACSSFKSTTLKGAASAALSATIKAARARGANSYAASSATAPGTPTKGSAGAAISKLSIVTAQPLPGTPPEVLPASPPPEKAECAGTAAGAAAVQWLSVHSAPVVAVAASSGVVVTTGADGILKVLQACEGSLQLAASLALGLAPSAATSGSGFRSHGAWTSTPGSCLALSSNGAVCAAGNVRGSRIWVVDVKTGAAALELEGHAAAVTRVLLPPCSSHGGAHFPRPLLSCGRDGCVRLWDPRDGPRAAATLTAAASSGVGAAPLTALASGGPGSVMVAAGGLDGRVAVWDVRQPQAPLASCLGHDDQITQIAFLDSATGSGTPAHLVTASRDWTARVWERDSGACRGVAVGHAGAVTALAVLDGSGAGRSSSGAPCIATGGEDGTVAVWGPGCSPLSLQQAHAAPVRLVDAAGSGSDGLVTAAGDMDWRLWDAPAVDPGRPLQVAARVPVQRRALVADGAAAFDPASSLLIGGHRDGTITAWRAVPAAQV